MEKIQRNYGIDLLRLVSMFMVVTLHVLGAGGILNSFKPLTLTNEVLWSLEIACYCAVDVFAIISGFVGYRSVPKYENIIRFTIQCYFYAILAIICIGVDNYIHDRSIFSINMIRHLWPFASDTLWYFWGYFLLVFFMPILNVIIEKVSQKQLKTTGVFIFLIFCCYSRIYSNVLELHNGYSLLWLAILYVVGGYLARYKPLEKFSKRICLISYFVCIVMTIASKLFIQFLTNLVFGEAKGGPILVAYTSPTIVLSAVFLVCYFAKLGIGNKFSSVITVLAPLSFGVYLFHCQPYFMEQLNGVFTFNPSMKFYTVLPIAIFISVFIFSFCLVVDFFRSKLFKILRISTLSKNIQHFLIKVFSFV